MAKAIGVGIYYLLAMILGIILILPMLLMILGITHPQKLVKILKDPNTWKPFPRRPIRI